MEHRKVNKPEHKGKKGLAAFLFSRIFIFGLMVALQVLVFVLLAYNASLSKGMSYFISFMQFVVVIYIVNDKSDPTMKLIWVIFIMFVPALGILMYFYAKFQLGSIILKKRLEHIDVRSERYLQPDQNIYNDLQIQDKQVSMIAKYIYDNTGCPVYRNTEVTYLNCGEEKYRALIEQLEEAQDFIFMEYFIIEEGRVWNSILRVLEKKVQQGVEVRVMYDGLCSLTKLPIGYFKKLRKKGIKSKTFAPARPFFTTQQNNRDHRKILVIDGKVAFTGGINLADEYMNVIDRFGYWKDTAVMLRGDAARSYTLMFLQMWNVSEKTIGNFDRYLDVEIPLQFPNNGYVIGYGDDPFGKERIGESVYLHIINTANRYLHIVTPYLVIDNVMMSSLKFAAKRGVDVKIVMPGIPDKAYAYCIARTYYNELIEAGVEIYEYTPGFTHAKMFISDDEKATVGTINLDYRSLFLHFENGCFIYKNKTILDIEQDYQQMLSDSKKVSLIECRNRPIVYKACGKLLRLLAPLM
ncbi:cardiolipin synthase [uncultured Eubacterium sp.]|uniref:cardiolipin synthase n=1 Tax=uncultured Eubacterium sp. TaxID=165185 RepID=UPI002671147B|nr:cardiolipin synthase [uncultured Eubacterium sp.]